MINENRLIELLEEEILRIDTESKPGCGNLYGRDASVMKNTLNFVIDLINEQPKVGEWIPVEERLPEDLMTVNVTWFNRKPQTYYSYIKDKPFVDTALRFNGKWYWWSVVTEDILREYGESVMDEIDNGIEVLAWRPLPESYEVRENE